MNPSSLHAIYTSATGLDVAYNMTRHYVWEQWSSHGWNEADLKAVIALVKAKNRAGGKWSLDFNSLIRDWEKFEELLARTRLAKRKATIPTARAAALRATGRSDEPPISPAKSADQIIGEHLKNAEMLRQWRIEALGVKE